MAGLRGSPVRIEARLDGTMSVRFHGAILRFAECATPERTKPGKLKPAGTTPPVDKPGRKWMQSFTVKDAPSWREIYRSGGLNRI